MGKYVVFVVLLISMNVLNSQKLVQDTTINLANSEGTISNFLNFSHIHNNLFFQFTIQRDGENRLFTTNYLIDKSFNLKFNNHFDNGYYMQGKGVIPHPNGYETYYFNSKKYYLLSGLYNEIFLSKVIFDWSGNIIDTSYSVEKDYFFTKTFTSQELNEFNSENFYSLYNIGMDLKYLILSKDSMKFLKTETIINGVADGEIFPALTGYDYNSNKYYLLVERFTDIVNYYESDNFLYVLDSARNIIHKKLIDTTTGFSANILKCDGEKIYISSLKKKYVLVTDLEGNEIKIINNETPNLLATVTDMILIDDGIIIAGYEHLSKAPVTTDYFIKRYDKNLNLVWKINPIVDFPVTRVAHIIKNRDELYFALWHAGKQTLYLQKYIDETLSVDNKNDNKKELLIFPNPTNNILNLQFESELDCIAKIEILNLNGKIVKHLENIQIETGLNEIKLESIIELPNGNYTIKVSNNETILGLEKFIKN